MSTPRTFTWIWQRQQWPSFTWDTDKTTSQSTAISRLQNKLVSGYDSQNTSDLEIDTLLTNVLSSSQIEGEHLDAHSVRSSLANKMGIATISDKQNSPHDSPAKIKSDGLARITANLHLEYEADLSLDRLFFWHQNLFPSGSYVDPALKVGSVRTSDDMKIVSGSWDSPTVHFVAPASPGLQNQLSQFIEWYNKQTQITSVDFFSLAAVAHLWFLTLHPFDDGNGRIARAISDLTVTKQHPMCARLYSISEKIAHNKNDYYTHLEQTQKGGLDITPWVIWFNQVIEQSLQTALHRVQRITDKTNFWKNVDDTTLNTSQQKVLNKLFDNEKTLKLTNRLYQKVAKVSKPTATRHLADLVEQGCLTKQPDGGRSIHYTINEDLLR